MKLKIWLLLVLCLPLQAQEEESKPKGPNIVQVLERGGHYNTLIAAIQEAAMVDQLSKGGPYTLFAPTDEAFVRLFPGILEKWLQSENRQELRAVLLYHLVKGKLTIDQIRRAQTLQSLQGEVLVVTVGVQQIEIDDATMGKGLQATNGIIYPIDRVLTPTQGELFGD